MATLRSSIQVIDNMSPAIKSMSNAMNILIGGFERLQTSSNDPLDINSMKLARQELAKAQANVQLMENDIAKANSQQKNFNNSLSQGESKSRNLLSNIKAFIGAYVGIQTAQGGMNITDDVMNAKARLGNITSGLQEQLELQNQIFKAAQRSRGEYLGMTDSVAKLGLLAGEAFSGNNEIVRFTELMNKALATSGASTVEKQASMYQLTQAMASGKLQGDEMRSIRENAPLLAKSIESYMKNVVKAKGDMKEWSKEGMITSDVIKAALFSAGDAIEEKFKNIPLTFGTMWTQIKNQAIYSLDGVMTKLNEVLNTTDGKNLMTGITSSLIVFGTVLGTLLTLAVQFGSFISDNWGMIAPIIFGLVSAITALNVVTGINNIITGISGGIQAFKAAQTAWATGMTLAQVAATETATGAQIGLNTAMMANPIGLVVLAVVALIGVFYMVIGAINKFAGTSISATGIIFGVFSWLGAAIGNIFIGLANLLILVVIGGIVNGFIWLVNTIYKSVTLGIQGMINNFKSFGTIVLNILAKVAGVMDKIFKTNTSGFVSSMQNSLNSLKGPETKDIIQSVGVKEKLIKGIDMDKSYSQGYDMGKGFGDKVKGAFNMDNSKFDFNGMDPTKLDPNGNLGKIADNTKKTKEKLDINGEDLKYMRDIAEREAINKFTTGHVKVEMTNHNNINSDLDLDGVINHLTNKVEEGLTTTAEGVHK